MSKETITVSLVNLHTRMPKKAYMLGDSVDLNDINVVRETIGEFLVNRVWVQNTWGNAINQITDELVTVATGNKDLEVYVNGPSYVVTTLVELCALNGVHLKLWFYNEKTKAWDITQEMF